MNMRLNIIVKMKKGIDMNDTPTIVTYHSTNNQPPWFAYCKPNGEFLGVRFEGATESEAIERAKAWWTNETLRQKRLCGAVELDDDEVSSKPFKQEPVSSGWGSGWSEPTEHHAHGLAGKIWMIHHQQKIKKRVDPNEVDKYVADGYVRGGPKTKFES